MLIKREIELGMDVYNVTSFYSDPSNKLAVLQERYTGRCLRGCYIVSIDRIVRSGECIIAQDGDPDKGTFSITCEVTAIVHARGEVINNCRVVKKDLNGMYLCTTAIENIMLTKTPQMESITVDQTISVRVIASRYSELSEKINVQAELYLPTTSAVVYRWDPTNGIDDELLRDVRDRLTRELESKSRIDKKAWDTFDQLLYAYNAQQKPPPGVRVVPLDALPKEDPAWVAYDPREPTSNAAVYVYSEAPAEYTPLELTASEVLLLLLEHYHMHLRTIREMVETYTSDMIKTHSNLWLIYKKNKK